MEKLYALEKEMNEYVAKVVKDDVIDLQELIGLAKRAGRIVDEIDADGILTDDEQKVYNRVSKKLKDLVNNYSYVDFDL